MKRLSNTIWVVVLCLQVLVAGLVAWIWLDWHNTLANNGRWIVAKRELALAVMGTEPFYEGRQALAGGQLNLGSWHGYHQVTFRDQLDLKQLHVNFDMDESSYLYFLFGSDIDQSYALRLSTNRMYRSAWLRIKDTGEFIESTPMPTVRLLAKNNSVSLILNQNRDEVGVIVNGEYYGHFPVSPFFIKKFGFRGGANSVRINHVLARDFADAKVVDESFDNQQGWLTLTSRILAVFLIINASILLLEMRLLQPSKWLFGKAGRVMLLLTVSVLLVTVTTGIFQRYFAHRYPELVGWFTSIFQAEKRYLEIHSLEMTDEFFKWYSLKPKPNTYRIMMIGSSQTWGAGSAHIEDGMVSVLQRLADADQKYQTRKYEFIAAAVSGQMASDLYTLYEQHWNAFEPNMVVINLSNNDVDAVQFEASLESFINLAVKRKTPIVFILEANSTEQHPIVANHAVMKRVAEKHSISVIDTHSYMATQEQTGILWWDYVHPTSYGHYLLGSYIYQNIKPILPTLQ